LIALLPANRVNDTVESHGGLTFGGSISDSRMTAGRMLQVISELSVDRRARGVKKLVYKAVPHIYHLLPAEEDLYALFVHGARLVRRDVSSTIATDQRLPLAKDRKYRFKLAQTQGLRVERSQNLSQFMAIAEANLESRYASKPVHTAAEIQLLANRFPENVKLFAANCDGEMLGGAIIYESTNVAHTQYIGTTPKGRALGALDAVMDFLLNEVYLEKPYFDFGISTVDNGRSLNHGLIRNKESYGARSTVYDFYELDLKT
jgi:hypothetical protein